MNKKVLYITIYTLLFCCISYLLYVLFNNNYINTIVKNNIVLFFVLLISIALLFFLFFLFKLERDLNMTLTNDLKEKDNQVKYLTKFIENELKEEIVLCKENEKKFYEKLRISSLNELISNIAHHWRQPLSVISLAATSVELYKYDKSINKENILENMYLINENVQNLSKTLDRFDGFKMCPNKKEVFTLEHALSTIELLTSSYDINLNYTLEEKVSLYGNECELLEVFYTIIKNSHDVFEQRNITHKNVYIDIQTSSKLLKIKIKDTAGGIEENIKNRIFEPYFSTKHHSCGIGLSLYMVYIIITEKMKGKIEVENVTFKDEEMNKTFKGAKFCIEIPRV